MGLRVLYCHLLALVFQTDVVIVSRLGHRDLAADSSRYLLTRLPPRCFALFLSSLSLSQSSAWCQHGLPNACDLHFKPPNAFVLASSCLSPCGLCKLIFLFHLNYWHFVFIGCKSWLKWLYLTVVVLLWGHSQPGIYGWFDIWANRWVFRHSRF